MFGMPSSSFSFKETYATIQTSINSPAIFKFQKKNGKNKSQNQHKNTQIMLGSLSI